MAENKTSWKDYGTNPLSQKQIILNQLNRCCILFSGFDESGVVVDEKLQKYDYTLSGLRGKQLALSVLMLRSLSVSVLPKEFFDRTQALGRKAFGYHSQNVEEQNYPRLYMSSDSQKQMEALEYIIEYFEELCTALFLLPGFRDVENVSVGGGNDSLEYDKPVEIEAGLDEEK